jgi:hypothetical protein
MPKVLMNEVFVEVNIQVADAMLFGLRGKLCGIKYSVCHF